MNNKEQRTREIETLENLEAARRSLGEVINSHMGFAGRGIAWYTRLCELANDLRLLQEKYKREVIEK